MDKLIPFNQSTFLKDRLLVGEVVANELVDITKKSKKFYFIFKLDFEKLNYTLSRFRFNYKLRS